MILIWSQQAENDRENIINFIAQDDVNAAISLDIHISNSALKLIGFPRLGHKGRIENTYELTLHAHYILVYQINGERIEIITIVHTSRKYP